MTGLLLVIAAWGSLWLRQPRWVPVLCTIAVLFVGTLLVLVGLIRAGFGDPAASGVGMWVAGALMLLSRAAIVARIVLEALAAPNSP